MQYPIVIERDSAIVDFSAEQSFSQSESNLEAVTWNVRSDGVQRTNYGVLTASQEITTTTADKTKATGLHITGPADGDELTLYCIQAFALSDDPNVRPVLFIAESPASITSASAGDVCTTRRILAAGTGLGTEGSQLAYHGVVAVDDTPNGRGVVFGIGMSANSSGGAATKAIVNMTVRRLVGVDPRVLDTRKLG